MKTSSAKSKGRRLCSEIKDLLYKYAPDLYPGDIEVTSSGCTGPDLKLSPAARKKYPFVIECKNQEKINIHSALKQSESHPRLPHETPLLFFSRNNSKSYVILEAEEFIRQIT